MKGDQSFDKLPTSSSKIPFNVETELNYKRIFIVKEKDPFKIIHICQPIITNDYQIYGELPDKSKKLLFTVSEHFQCECCDCDNWGFNFACFSLICCDKIIFQLDYRKNNKGFYTQGYYQRKGCYICSNCWEYNFGYCCPYHTLYLRENTDHNNPDFDIGIKKGRTKASVNICCTDRTSFYISEKNSKGYGIRAKYCEICRHKCLRKFGNITCDFEIKIEDEKGNKCGNIMIYSGICSKVVKGTCCYFPKPYFEINMPKNISSIQKFQIIADTIHFDYVNNVL